MIDVVIWYLKFTMSRVRTHRMVRLEFENDIERYITRLLVKVEREKLFFPILNLIDSTAWPKTDSIFLTITWNNKKLFSVLLDPSQHGCQYEMTNIVLRQAPCACWEYVPYTTQDFNSFITKTLHFRRMFRYLEHWPFVSKPNQSNVAEIINYL